MYCIRCDVDNASGSRFCKACGLALTADADGRREPRLHSDFSQVPLPRSTAPDAKDGHGELLAMAIGPKNQERYLRKFAEFERNGRTSVGWHWPAFFATFYWLLYRKLWAKAALYFFVPYIVFVVGTALLASVSMAATGLFSIVYLIAWWCLPAMFADGWLYQRCCRIIEEAKSVNDNLRNQLIQVSRSGQTSSVAVIVLLVLFIPGIGILAAVALPAYQDYTVRARLSDAILYGQSATLAVGNFYERKQGLPRNLGEAGFDMPPSQYVRDIQINPSNGTLTLVLGEQATAGKTIEFVPSLDADKRVIWKCQPGTVAARYLPSACRPA